MVPAFAADDPAAVRHFSEAGWVATADADGSGPTPERLRAWADELADLDPAVGVLHYVAEPDRGPAR
ncbi:MAG: hypothetical protein ACKOVH_06560, partial [Actinomycetota bacterium]